MAEAYSNQSALSFDGQGDLNLWLLKMKFWCSTKGYTDKKEADAMAPKLTGAAFLVVARMPEKDQDSPEAIRKALKAEFDKSVLDRETASPEVEVKSTFARGKSCATCLLYCSNCCSCISYTSEGKRGRCKS